MIVHEDRKEWAPESDNRIYDDIKDARLTQNRETPVDERIKYATWPETALYFSTLSLDERCTGENVSQSYQHSFREYLSRHTDGNIGALPEPLSTDPELDDYELERLDDLRFGIKKDRDKYFVDQQYDELGVEAVPKSFWLTDYEQSRKQTGMDDFSQSALDQFDQV